MAECKRALYISPTAKGLFATRDFPKGTEVLAETPWFESKPLNWTLRGTNLVAQAPHFGSRSAWATLREATDIKSLLATQRTFVATDVWDAEDQAALDVLSAKFRMDSKDVKRAYLIVTANHIQCSTESIALSDQVRMVRPSTWGFCPTIAYINHACNPSTTMQLPSVAMWSRTQPAAAAATASRSLVCVMALRDIKKGDEITMNYTAPQKAQTVQQGWGFECRCASCQHC
jgi:hypothetical protein